MDVLGDAVARDRRSDAPALRHAATGRSYDYRRFCTTAWKTGNLLRNEGVRAGMDVTVAPDAAPEAVLTFYGAALLGARVEFEPSTVSEETKALVAPTLRLADYQAGPRTRRIGYGDGPDDPSVAHFERDVWSENPTAPPDEIAAEEPLVRASERTFDHRDILRAARTVVDDCGIEEGDEVTVRGSLTDPGVVAGGLVAPILAGATIVLADGGSDDGVVGDVAVGAGPEPTVVHPADVLD